MNGVNSENPKPRYVSVSKALNDLVGMGTLSEIPTKLCSGLYITKRKKFRLNMYSFKGNVQRL